MSDKIPSKPDELTQEWFRKVFANPNILYYKQRNHAEVEAVQSVKISKTPSKQGFLSTATRAEVQTKSKNGEFHHKVFVKLVPQDEVFFDILKHSRYDLKEVNFYNTLLQDLQNHIDKRGATNIFHLQVPKPIHVEGKRSTPESILVLEDLAVKGFKQFPFNTDWTHAMLQAAVECLARIQATAWSYFQTLNADVLDKYPFMKIRAEDIPSHSGELYEVGRKSITPWLADEPTGCQRVLEFLEKIQPKVKFYKN